MDGAIGNTKISFCLFVYFLFRWDKVTGPMAYRESNSGRGATPPRPSSLLAPLHNVYIARAYRNKILMGRGGGVRAPSGVMSMGYASFHLQSRANKFVSLGSRTLLRSTYVRSTSHGHHYTINYDGTRWRGVLT